jgi:hypothetical protein
MQQFHVIVCMYIVLRFQRLRRVVLPNSADGNYSLSRSDVYTWIIQCRGLRWFLRSNIGISAVSVCSNEPAMDTAGGCYAADCVS